LVFTLKPAAESQGVGFGTLAREDTPDS
jgi:hypothetical protein